MRISAAGANAIARDTSAVRRSPSSATFSLGDATEAAARGRTGQLQAVAGIDTLVALQGLDDTTERRRRAVRKGRGALDALDELKVALLSGSLDQSAVNRLRALSADLTEHTGDSGLDAVLADIDLRMQVEIAKLTRR